MTNKMIEAKAPENYIINKDRLTIFLAGSIEMGKAENWQDKVKRLLKDEDVLILNPRRDEWDTTWVQSIDNYKFREQVVWELDAMDKADKILMYFDPATKSPISLLELGLFADSERLVVVCPEGFWRKGNVDIVCSRYEIKQAKTIEEAINISTLNKKR